MKRFKNILYVTEPQAVCQCALDRLQGSQVEGTLFASIDNGCDIFRAKRGGYCRLL